MNAIPAEKFIHESRGGTIIDVRSPNEFAAGHIPNATNIPLFSDEQRATIGTIYADAGRDEAVSKGLEFVGPKMADFVHQTRALLSGNRSDVAFVHCWRGGMRSQSFAWLLETSGINVRVLSGLSLIHI